MRLAPGHVPVGIEADLAVAAARRADRLAAQRRIVEARIERPAVVAHAFVVAVAKEAERGAIEGAVIDDQDHLDELPPRGHVVTDLDAVGAVLEIGRREGEVAARPIVRCRPGLTALARVALGGTHPHQRDERAVRLAILDLLGDRRARREQRIEARNAQVRVHRRGLRWRQGRRRRHGIGRVDEGADVLRLLPGPPVGRRLPGTSSLNHRCRQSARPRRRTDPPGRQSCATTVLASTFFLFTIRSPCFLCGARIREHRELASVDRLQRIVRSLPPAHTWPFLLT